MVCLHTFTQRKTTKKWNKYWDSLMRKRMVNVSKNAAFFVNLPFRLQTSHVVSCDIWRKQTLKVWTLNQACSTCFQTLAWAIFHQLPTFKKGCPHYVHNFHYYANSLCSKNLTTMLKKFHYYAQNFFPRSLIFLPKIKYDRLICLYGGLYRQHIV